MPADFESNPESSPTMNGEVPTAQLEHMNAAIERLAMLQTDKDLDDLAQAAIIADSAALPGGSTIMCGSADNVAADPALTEEEPLLPPTKRPLRLAPGLLEYVWDHICDLGIYNTPEELLAFLDISYRGARYGLPACGVDWTDYGYSVVVGCTKVSRACKFCYAKALHDLRHMIYMTTGGVYPKNGKAMPRQYEKPFEVVQQLLDRLGSPLHKRKPGRVFLAPQSDLFHEENPPDFIRQVFLVMGACPHLQFQVLTKRPDLAAKMADELPWFPNIWIGATVEARKYYDRIDLLRKIPATRRFLSIEPLFESMADIDLSGIDWVVVGGESGFPKDGIDGTHPDWFREIRDKCESLGIAFYFKQHGFWVHESQLGYCNLTGKTKGRQVHTWPDGTKSYRFGRVNTHDILDGRQHKDFPPNAPGFLPVKASPTKGKNKKAGSKMAKNNTTKPVKPGKNTNVQSAATAAKSATAGLSELPVFTTPDGGLFAKVPVRHGHYAVPLQSQAFRDHLAGRIALAEGKAPSQQRLADEMRLLRGRARRDGDCLQVFTRVAPCDGGIAIDPHDGSGDTIQVTDKGISLGSTALVMYAAQAGACPAEIAAAPATLEEIQQLLGLDDDNFGLCIAFMLAAYMPNGPYPILAIYGHPSSGKSTLTRFIKQVVDPAGIPTRGLPETEKELARLATECHVLAFDNASRIPRRMNDPLCRLSTGGGLQTGNSDQPALAGQRPVILNGVTDLVETGDLRQRVWSMELARVPKAQRTPGEFEAQIDAMIPRVRRLMLELISAGLKHQSTVEIATTTRMAHAAHWACACLHGTGWSPQRVMDAIHGSESHGAANALENSVLLECVVAFARSNGKFEGKMTQLLDAVREQTHPSRRRHLPVTANIASREINRGVGLLKQLGVEFEKLPGSHRDGRRYKLAIIGGGDGNDKSDAPSADTHCPNDPWESGNLCEADLEAAAAIAEAHAAHEYVADTPWGDASGHCESDQPQLVTATVQ